MAETTWSRDLATRLVNDTFCGPDELPHHDSLEDAIARFDSIIAEASVKQLDVSLLAEALFEARIGVPADTPILAEALLPPLRRLWLEEATVD